MIVRMTPSKAQRDIFKKTGLQTVEEILYADLRAVGWDKADAFYAAYRDQYINYPKREVQRIIKRMEDSPAIAKRMAQTAGREDTGDENRLSGTELAKETSKEKILSDLVLARKRMREGTKEWADITKMIGDYAKIKQDDIKTDEEPIKYFLPVHYPRSCADCLIAASKRSASEEEVNGVED